VEERKFYYSIMSIRLKKKEAEAYCAVWGKEHFLPDDRFRVIAENDHYRVVCKVYECELPQFEFRNLKNYRKTLIHQTEKVLGWLYKRRKHKAKRRRRVEKSASHAKR
jgi:hypothetical protein